MIKTMHAGLAAALVITGAVHGLAGYQAPSADLALEIDPAVIPATMQLPRTDDGAGPSQSLPAVADGDAGSLPVPLDTAQDPDGAVLTAG